jgi:hypothetical protein
LNESITQSTKQLSVSAEQRDSGSVLFPKSDKREAKSKSKSKISSNSPQLEWRAPQLGIITALQKKPKKKNQLCAGCSLEFGANLFKVILWCEYTGQYYCKNCHSKKKACIPARLIHQWDHRSYSVSNLALSFLESIKNEAVFDMVTLNPDIYKLSKTMTKIRVLRKQLFHLKDFIVACSARASLLDPAERRGMYLIYTIEKYSLADLQECGGLLHFLREFAETLLKHVGSCLLCQARGSICEFDGEIIYPFEIAKVTQCPNCLGFFHRTCLHNNPCPRCARIEQRKHKSNLIAQE